MNKPIRFAPFALLAAIIGCGGGGGKPKASFKPSKETTYITEPVDADGYLDYETALNERLRGTITPETNANVLLWQALGPKPEGREVHPDYFKWLKVERPPEDGDYYKDWVKFSRTRGSEKTTEELLDEQFTSASTQPWKTKELPDLSAWLDANAKPLETLRKASLKTDYYNPLVSRPSGRKGLMIGALLPSLQQIRSMADALAKRAMWHVGEGRRDDAWKDLMTIRRVGRLLSIRGKALIEILVGAAIEEVANSATLSFVEATKLDARTAAVLITDLKRLPELAPLGERIDTNERFMILDIVQATQRYGFDTLKTLGEDRQPHEPDAAMRLLLNQLDWDVIFRKTAGTFDRAAEIFNIKDRSKRRKGWESFEADLRKQSRELGDNSDVSKVIREGGALDKAVSEKIGTILVTKLFPAVGRVQNALDRIDQRIENLQLAFALAAHRADHGKYPAQLADLAPKFIDKVPLDYFSDKPLVYKPTADGYLLYSVGENGRDDGGATFSDEPSGDDLTVRMPAKVDK